MTNIPKFIILVISVVMIHSFAADAAKPEQNVPDLDLRYGRHNDYIRVVLEGPHDIITKSQVNEKDRNVQVTFSNAEFSLKDRDLPIKYRKDNHTLIFEQINFISIKKRTMSDPSRLVIDFYTKRIRKVKNKTKSTGNKTTEAMNKEHDKPDLKEGKKTEITSPVNAKKENPEKTIAEQQPSEPEYDKPKQKKPEIKEVHNNIPAENNTEEAGGETVTSQNVDKNITGKIKTAKRNNKDFVPPQYKKLWTLLETGNHYGLLTALPEYKPEGVRSVAVYHYMYGAASYGAKKYLDAIKHLRLAYIYASNRILKEKALSLRAKTYMDTGFLQEASADYKMLIESFPASTKIRKAHLGFADSLSKLGLYSKAVKEYDKAGNAAEVLYSKANALQRLERVKDAKTIYDKAHLADEKYPERSGETYYLIGENMRMIGDL